MQQTAAVRNDLDHQPLSSAFHSRTEDIRTPLQGVGSLQALAASTAMLSMFRRDGPEHYQLLDQTSKFILHRARDVNKYARAMHTDTI